jgi:DNA-binding NarL/FixJ family response regulator
MTHAPAKVGRRSTSRSQEEATRPDLLHLLLIGRELHIEAFKALLTTQADLQVLGLISLTDLEQISQVVDRIEHTASPLDVIVLDWEGAFETQAPLLRELQARGERCLVIASWHSKAELRSVQEAGAWGYCWTGASPLQVIQAIRRIAAGHQSFPSPPITAEPAPPLSVQRRPLFYRERLEARAAEIGWQLSEVEIALLAHFASSQTTQELAQHLGRRPATVRTDLSARVYLFLTLLSGYKKIPNRLTALQLLLEFGIIEYR